jgi:hypothetical protein
MDDVRRAYAVLGLPADSSYAAVRRRYRALVKTWHPDRFAADPQAQAEANIRMRAINAAYTTLMERQVFSKFPGTTYQARASAETERRLSREEIDTMVAGIGTEGPLDGLLGAFGLAGSTINRVLAALIMLGLVPHVAIILLIGNWGELLKPGLVLFLGIVVVLAVIEGNSLRPSVTKGRPRWYDSSSGENAKRTL